MSLTGQFFELSTDINSGCLNLDNVGKSGIPENVTGVGN